jgi:hypothetical protein
MSQSIEASEASSLPSPPKRRTDDRSRATNACGACQQRKTRCSGGNPCSACEARSTQCSYNAALDQRRRIANIRNIEELARKEDDLRQQKLLLGGLLGIMRSGDSDTTKHIMSAIRQDKDLSDLRSLIESTIITRPELRSQIAISMMDDKLSPSPSPTTSIPPGNRFSHDFVINAPITVNANPWTTLASSEVVSHLLSVYFTWEHPLYQFIDKSMFLVGYKRE